MSPEAEECHRSRAQNTRSLWGPLFGLLLDTNISTLFEYCGHSSQKSWNMQVGLELMLVSDVDLACGLRWRDAALARGCGCVAYFQASCQLCASVIFEAFTKDLPKASKMCVQKRLFYYYWEPVNLAF